MIIWIDESFTEVDLHTNAICRDAIEAACVAAARGQHYFFGPRAVLRAISEFTGFSKTAKGLLSDIIDQYSFLAGLANRLTYRIDMRHDLNVVERISDTHWAVPASQIADHGVRPTVLLAENSRDADIYINAAKHFQINDKLSDVQICIEPRNGNGAGISAELDRISTRPAEWCLCVTDSDIEFPGGERGIIAKACSRVVERQPHAVTRHIATTGRELENAIPVNLLAEVVERTHAAEWQRYVDCQEKIGGDALQFADLKNGLKICQLLSKNNNAPERIYWINKLKDHYRDLECIENNNCGQPQNSRCVVFNGFGDRTAEHVQENMLNSSPRKIFNSAKSSRNFDDWLALGRHVFFAAAAPKRLRV